MACAVSLFRRVTDIVILWVDGYRVITAADGRRGDRVRAAHLLRPDPARPLPPEGGRHPDDQGAAQLSHGAVDADHRRCRPQDELMHAASLAAGADLALKKPCLPHELQA